MAMSFPPDQSRERSEATQVLSWRGSAVEPNEVQRAFLADIRRNARAPKRAIHGPSTTRRLGNRPGLSQEEVAGLMEISNRHYSDLERGESRWSEDMVIRFERAVGLDGDGEQATSTRSVLWNLLLGYCPRTCGTGLAVADQLHIDNQTSPTCISNGWWEVVYRNAGMVDWIPALQPGTNIMVWVMSRAGSRTLLSWEQDWVRPMLAQLRAAYYGSLGGNSLLAERLVQVVDEICKTSPVAGHYWHEDRHRFHLGPSGAVRRMIHPTEGEKTVVLWSARALGTPNARILSLYAMPEEAACPSGSPPCVDRGGWRGRRRSFRGAQVERAN